MQNEEMRRLIDNVGERIRKQKMKGQMDHPLTMKWCIKMELR